MLRMGLVALLMALPMTPVEAFCSPYWQQGNELDAPTALVDAFRRSDWVAFQQLMTTNVQLVVVDSGGGATIAKGPSEVTSNLRQMVVNGELDKRRFSIVNLRLGPNHWVWGRLFSENIPEPRRSDKNGVPIMEYVSPHPIYWPFYSISFLPDCMGKVENVVVVEHSVIEK